MKFIERLANYSDESILKELRRVATALGKPTLTMDDLKHSRVCYATLKNRFGGLRSALKKAGLESPTFNRDVSQAALVQELQRIWDIVLQKEGRRPLRKDLKKYGARYSVGPFYRKWGSWIKACEAVVEAEEQSHVADADDSVTPSRAISARNKSKIKRGLPLRTRYEVLRRDKFTCMICGRTPGKHKIELHVDHVIPESKGGSSELSNLRTLCNECNVGKGDL